jgi:glycine cleavage system T protein
MHYGEGAVEEHKLVRASCGVFDISHMGQVEVSGSDAGTYLDWVITNDIGSMQPGESRYGLLCKEDGGVVDDIFTYRLPDRYYLVVNAANHDKDLDWLKSHVGSYDAVIKDRSDQTAMIAVQGPNAMQVADALTGGKASSLARFGVGELEAAGVPAIVGRTGYTGEDGVEIFVANEEAERVWHALFDAAADADVQIGPVGLAARDSLRFEPGMPLYGHELDEETTPLEARLKWACHFDRDFLGRDALLEQQERGLGKRLVTIEMVDRGVPREGYSVLAPDGTEIGRCVTGMYAPTLNWYYANAFVDPAFTKVGTECSVDIRGRRKAATVAKRPLYRPSYR